MSLISLTPEGRPARLLDALPAIAWSASAQTFRFNYVNPAAEKVLGYPARCWIEEPDFWVSHLHPDDRHVAKLCHNETVACRNHELVYRMVAADGRTVWIRDYVNVHSVNGRAVELFGVMIDITREREAELAWNESRENFRRMVELSPDCMGVLVDDTYVYVNRAFVTLLGASSEVDIVGRNGFSFIHPAHRDAVRERMERVQAGESVPYARRQFRRIDGSYVDVEVAALPLRYDNRAAVQIIARDITDRVRAEAELQVREARLDLLASGTHEAIWEWFPERKQIWTNAAYRQMFGPTGDEATFFDAWLSQVHPDDREDARAVFEDAIDKHLPNWWHEYRLRQADGSYAVVRDRGHIVKSPSGEHRVLGAIIDVTPLREAERMRAAAEAKFRWLVEQSVVGVYMMSGDRLTYINDTGARMFGYTSRELMSMDLRELLLVPEAPADVFGGAPGVARIRRKNGTRLYIAFYPNEVTVDGETIIIGTAADITESVEARHALEASEQRYRELVDGISEIIYTLDREGCFTSLSTSFERSTGYRVDEWLGRPFADLFRARPVPAMHGAQLIREYDLSARSGAAVTLEVSSQPHYVDGVLIGTIGMARDVTEHRNVARKLEEAKRLSGLGHVAASLAHEFNNVLMGIQPFVEVIGRKAPNVPGVTDALAHITRAVGRGKRASQEILRFANPKEPQLSSIDAQGWLPTFLRQLAAALPASITLSSSMDARVDFIHGDREQLEQVITNLVFNARDAIAGGGTIHAEISRDDRFVQIAVSDSGCGIPPHVIEQIFEPLFTTKRNGTGLGLAIARRLMEAQGGSLTAENRAEGGATFRVRVPAGSAAPSLAAEGNAAFVPAVKRVLLVEDDPSVGAGLEALLNAEGYETAWVRSAAEVCDVARRLQPHIAIIDVNLPDGSGIDLVPLLRAEHDDLPIILSTGHVEVSLADEERRILPLLKPYQFRDLMDAIGTVVN